MVEPQRVPVAQHQNMGHDVVLSISEDEKKTATQMDFLQAPEESKNIAETFADTRGIGFHEPYPLMSYESTAMSLTQSREGSEEPPAPFAREMSFHPIIKTPRRQCIFYKDKHFYGDYRKIGTLGSGNFGEVRLVEHKLTKRRFAGKVFYKEGHHLHREGDFTQEEIDKECLIMSQIDHRNIVSLEAVYDESDRCTMVLGLAEGGEVRDYLIEKVEKCTKALKETSVQSNKNIEPLPSASSNSRRPTTAAALDFRPCGEHGLLLESEVAQFMVDAFAAVAYLHSRSIAHRDLKLENFLLKDKTKGTEIVLCDFGFAAQLPAEKCFTAYCGSLLYMAPEVLVMKNEHRRVAEKIGFLPKASSKLQGRSSRSNQQETTEQRAERKIGKNYGLECDLWSLGVCLFVLLTAEQPFGAAQRKETVANILQGKMKAEAPG